MLLKRVHHPGIVQCPDVVDNGLTGDLCKEAVLLEKTNHPGIGQCIGVVDNGLTGEVRREAILLKEMKNPGSVRCTEVVLFVFFSIVDFLKWLACRVAQGGHTAEENVPSRYRAVH